MNNRTKVGLWMPGRVDLSQPISKENPASLEVKVRDLFLEYLNKLDVTVYEHLDFRKAVIKNNEVWVGNFCMNDLDHFFWRGAYDSQPESYHLEVLRVLELSVTVHNSYSFIREACDKFSAFSLLHSHGIPVAEIYLVNRENVDFLQPLFEDSSFLMKPRRSGFGIGIVKIDHYTQLRDILDYYPKKNYYLEKFYPNDMSDWIGVTVINGHVLLGFRKKSSKISGWKVYDKNRIGGEVIYVEPNAEVKAIALKIGEILGGSSFGLDFIKTAEGYKVVDINCNPGLYSDLIEAYNLPVAEHFFKTLFVLQTQLIAA